MAQSPNTFPLRSRTTALVAAALAGLLVLAGIMISPGTAHAASVTATVAKDSTWDSGYTASVTVKNATGSTVNGWKVELTLPAGSSVGSHWNAERSANGAKQTFTNVGWNAALAPGASTSFGFTVNGTGEPTACTVNGSACSGGDLGPGPDPTVPPTNPNASPVQEHGKVYVCGVNLCDEDGRPVQLRGMSTHGIQWFDHCLTGGSLSALADDWKADIVRLSMYIQEGGYETNPRRFTDRMHDLIEESTARGMYVIVDWHMLSPGDPNHNTERAKTFFAEIAERHADKDNVIYEIANEPNGVSWNSIKSYSEQVIPVIRAEDPDSVILVGTRAWSSLGVSEGSSHTEITANPVNADNIMYTFHFYAASHGNSYLSELERASNVLPIFVTEFGTQDYSGEGANDFVAAKRYLDLLERQKISWVNWNFSDDHRSGAVFTEGTCTAGGPWAGTSRLKESGVWIRDQIRAGA
ncbi:cellulase family glycosylhydrolase [Nocardiopsis ansamitocini]|uniref:Endoglucanase n=1 Tax=Nocardiopsis ansamitocini TaxID=1670832 RepID=A0A9W6P379_9ACTN|nr:cellulase family glycosylhydrolase [Nocardiopsis ansamitocini]GLU46266.1 endoglucanase [Nocardiopsis ansamitocini]